jgi:hypothetical protein
MYYVVSAETYFIFHISTFSAEYPSDRVHRLIYMSTESRLDIRFGIRAQKLKNGSVRPVRERTAVQAADLQLSGQGG